MIRRSLPINLPNKAQEKSVRPLRIGGRSLTMSANYNTQEKLHMTNNLFVVVADVRQDGNNEPLEYSGEILACFVTKHQAAVFIDSDEIQAKLDSGEIHDLWIETPSITFSPTQQVCLFFTETDDPTSIAAGIFDK